jgi:DNA repair protein RAD5
MKDIHGNPIIPLPAKNVIKDYLKFSPSEQKIYDMIFQLSKSKFKSYEQSGTILQNVTAIFAILMRMRLCVLHPALALKKGVEELGGDEEEIEKMIERYNGSEVGGNGEVSMPFGTQVLRDLLEKNGQDLTDEECPICFEVSHRVHTMPVTL